MSMVVARLSIAIAFSLAYIYSAELFPTTLRWLYFLCFWLSFSAPAIDALIALQSRLITKAFYHEFSSLWSYFADATRQKKSDSLKLWWAAINLYISNLPHKQTNKQTNWHNSYSFALMDSHLFFCFSQECWDGNINSICSCERLCCCLRASFGEWIKGRGPKKACAVLAAIDVAVA